MSECAAIASEFRRAFGAARIEPLTAGGRPSRLGHGKRRRHRRGSGAGNDARAADGDGLGEGVQTAAAIYAQPFLREFLLSHGMSRTGIAALSAIWNDENQSIPLHRCLGLRGIKGCQVKMVLGVPCAAPFALNESLLAEAARRVASDFLFVGLTERWEASICLFHARLGGKALPIQFANSRRGQHHERSSSASETSLLSDEWDERLYQVAVHRFERDLAAARKATSIAVSSLHGEIVERRRNTPPPDYNSQTASSNGIALKFTKTCRYLTYCTNEQRTKKVLRPAGLGSRSRLSRSPVST